MKMLNLFGAFAFTIVLFVIYIWSDDNSITNRLIICSFLIIINLLSFIHHDLLDRLKKKD
jgi:hypothetical protein